MVGYFSSAVFEVSDRKALSFHNLKRGNVPRIGAHDLINRKPAMEFIGGGLETLSFTVGLHTALGVRVTTEIDRWNAMANRGEVGYFILGGKPVGRNKWLITSLFQAYGVITNRGGIVSAKLDVRP